jgi:hypothetical protein
MRVVLQEDVEAMRFARRRSRSQNPSAPMTTDVISPPKPLSSDLPEQLIAQRAYEKWQRRGCPMGQDGAQDWYAARAELEQERLGWAAPAPDDRQRGVAEDQPRSTRS